MTRPIPSFTKAECKLLAELAERIYVDELSAHLGNLRHDFDEWDRKLLTAFELSERIHRFHDGPSRQLYTRHTSLKPYEAVSRAIASGRMREADIPGPLLDKLRPLIDALRAIASES